MTDRYVAIVTGASRGLGLETAKALAALDYLVVATARAQDAAGHAAALLGSDRAVGRALDVADESSVDAFFDWLAEAYGRIDVLVNNAGRTFGSFQADIAATPPEQIVEAVDNNALGAYRAIRRALPMMNSAGYGRIVNISSGMGGLAEMGGGAIPYRISKTAMNAVTRIAASEAAANVKVNAVCPGWVRTDMGGEHAPRSLEEGVAGIVWAATLANDGPTGGFFRDGEPIAW